ncbi:MAG: sugar phosphate nucleotidyltransferase [Pyrinomonadaceae bacterium]
MREIENSNRYAVILAGGEGSRLKSLTRAISGDDRPKQFCPILGGKSLLDTTRDRVRLSVPIENTFFSLTAKHEKFYQAALWDVPESRRVVQPESRGTAPAILYSLMRVSVENPNAVVAIFPSDHFFTDDEKLMAQVDSAFRAAELESASVVLLGLEPDKPETSYGWIEPAASLFGGEPGGISRVSRFWEKPSRKAAEQLMASGCLWNSFVMVGRAVAFLEMFRAHLKESFRMFDISKRMLCTNQEKPLMRAIYSWLPDSNFSSDVLEKATEMLMVKRVAEVGWSDLGEPQRVLGTLKDLGIKANWSPALAA